MKNAFFIFVVAVLVSACMVIVPVKTSRHNGAMLFSVEKSGLVFKSDRKISLVSVTVRSGKGWKNEKTVWEIRTSGEAVPIPVIVYGIVPQEFVETTASIKMVKGNGYRVDIVGPGYTAYKEFIYE
ncbi:hypothetical protein [Microbulbifer sp. PSTR4-B]|uniref:hypothetical protein n=1 Tax=Microbulbifer sp. PSTR4-B TaxID=3243396 RepID=UPI00403995A4